MVRKQIIPLLCSTLCFKSGPNFFLASLIILIRRKQKIMVHFWSVVKFVILLECPTWNSNLNRLYYECGRYVVCGAQMCTFLPFINASPNLLFSLPFKGFSFVRKRLVFFFLLSHAQHSRAETSLEKVNNNNMNNFVSNFGWEK
jgi:hypothetical protein